jgi:hypothetical protein
VNQKNVFFVVAFFKKSPKNGSSPMPTHERPTHERSADGAKEKAAEGTNEGRPFRPTAPTDLPDELLKMITGSGVKGDPGVRRRWLSTQTEKLVEEKKHEGSFLRRASKSPRPGTKNIF